MNTLMNFNAVIKNRVIKRTGNKKKKKIQKMINFGTYLISNCKGIFLKRRIATLISLPHLGKVKHCQRSFPFLEGKRLTKLTVMKVSRKIREVVKWRKSLKERKRERRKKKGAD